MTPTRILAFAPFYPPHAGGVEYFMQDLHQELIKTDIEITVFAPQLPVSAASTETIGKINIIRFPAWEIVHNYPVPKYWPFFWSPKNFRLLRSLWSQRPDIIISHTRFFNASLLALLYAKTKRIPLLHIEHGSSFVKSGSPLVMRCAKLYDQTIGRLILKKADRVIAVSESAQEFAASLCPRKDYETIYRGFDSTQIDAIPESSAYPRTSSVRLIFFGRLISGKGIHILFEALKKISPADWELIVIGDGPEADSARRQAESFPGHKITFLGEKKRTDAIAILKTGDIVIHPSLTEGLPTAVAEAALCAKAVIATDVGGTQMLFPESDQHWLVRPSDANHLAEKISLLLNNTEPRALLGRHLRDHVIAHFSWTIAAQRYSEIISAIRKQ